MADLDPPPPTRLNTISRKPVAGGLTPEEEDSPASYEKPVYYPPQTLGSRFNRIFPPYKTYLGRSRKTFLCVLAAVLFLVILALALGLGLGLKKGYVWAVGLLVKAMQELTTYPRSPRALPLPSNRGIFTGDLTYYDPALGSCGIVSSSSENICAVSHLVYDALSTGPNPNANPVCGRKLRVNRFVPSEGRNRSVDVTVVDRCTGCKAEDVDLSIAAFEQVADEAEGRVVGSWAWL